MSAWCSGCLLRAHPQDQMHALVSQLLCSRGQALAARSTVARARAAGSMVPSPAPPHHAFAFISMAAEGTHRHHRH
ncbi:hypothetical protein SORBI_3005G042250 [Sorghum bicolor]|uniref:Uncharacterized protein n=1 Tax=Sorghum bicolor TaxID=4558 RepID=A0A1Z5RGK2_SORBI|nr:hypothetical protein SORBI_3005G042250 [Sorghum bicolor]